MQKIGSFLGKFKGKAAAQIQGYTLIIEIIKRNAGIELDMKDIKISSGNLIIKSSSVLKNEIFIKKNSILKDISQKVQGIKISNIR